MHFYILELRLLHIQAIEDLKITLSFNQLKKVKGTFKQEGEIIELSINDFPINLFPLVYPKLIDFPESLEYGLEAPQVLYILKVYN